MTLETGRALELELGAGDRVSSASEQFNQPVLSEPYTAANALAAHKEIRARWEVSQAELATQYSAVDVDLNNIVRTHPVPQRVSWPYETCSDVITMVPTPTGEWGISSDASIIRSPVTEDRAEITYLRFDPALNPAHKDFYQSEEYVQITVMRSPEAVQLFEMMYPNEALRAAMFEPGPYNYPLMTQTLGTLVGDISIAVSSTNENAANAYLTQMIGCAIKSGLIAKQIDPTSLAPVP